MDIALIPRILLDRFGMDPEKSIHLNVLLSSLILVNIAAFSKHLTYVLTYFQNVCVFKVMLGIPCPGCGVTRSILAFSTGNVAQAFAYNLAGPILLGTFVFQIPLRLMAIFGLLETNYVMKVTKILTSTVLVVLFVNWFKHVY